jgi:hypothetical protein
MIKRRPRQLADCEKTGATIVAINGTTAHQLMATFGWDTLKTAEQYTCTADQQRLRSTPENKQEQILVPPKRPAGLFRQKVEQNQNRIFVLVPGEASHLSLNQLIMLG